MNIMYCEVERGCWKVWGNENLQELNKELDINLENEFVKYEHLKGYGKPWFTTIYILRIIIITKK